MPEWLQNAAMGATGAGGVFYLAWRRLLRDRQGDNVLEVYRQQAADAAEQLLRERERLSLIIATERQRADGFAAERNTALMELGELRGQVKALGSKIEDMEDMIQYQTKLIQELAAAIPGVKHPHIVLTSRRAMVIEPKEVEIPDTTTEADDANNSEA